ncbi:MAG: hypothetical protein A2015_08955 [Spirochaetes bacterium GWF1_31_7]|nr:MAG: hypothetical protein A2Y30_06705 [Spirochaetes bacterium GWE1_32_154]OHD48049.1 MAG: hypothetical protein A2015_08955 [Spirochaetes bacterium GWF1_31_7]OHD81728.1 MAG: hypothetical protein A2355_07475 [Spirochaetes bacterium RIFOXYB1_FULL_32_8]HBD96186.1 hypothetical protein [Spirochaetia bacterium]HBI36476.1 hypothetical protein [Spirochaetia bacterium]
MKLTGNFFSLALLLVFLSCSEPKVDRKTVSIVKINWIIQNIDTSYWIEYNENASTLIYLTGMKLSGDPIKAGEIEHIKLVDTEFNYYWKFEVEKYFDEERQIIRNKRFSYKENVFPTNLRYEIKLKSGYIASYDFIVPAPGSKENNGNKFLYNEEGYGINSYYVQTLKRPEIKKFQINKDTKQYLIEFTIDDAMAFSGMIDFINKDGNIVAYYKNYFRAFSTSTIDSVINKGNYLYNDNTPNTIILSDNDISFYDGYSFDSIHFVIVHVTDGYQYENEPGTFDCQSISKKTIAEEVEESDLNENESVSILPPVPNQNKALLYSGADNSSNKSGNANNTGK